MKRELLVGLLLALLVGLLLTSCTTPSKPVSSNESATERELQKAKKEIASLKQQLSGEKRKNLEAPQPEPKASAEKTASVYTPPRGSTERQAILDAVRKDVGWKHLFIVRHLKVQNGWAYAVLDGYKPEDPKWKTDTLHALCRKRAGAWGVLYAGTGGDLPAVEEIDTWLRKKFSPPPEILP